MCVDRKKGRKHHARGPTYRRKRKRPSSAGQPVQGVLWLAHLSFACVSWRTAEPSPYLEALPALQAETEAEGKQCCVGALVLNPQGRVLVQKRAADRKLFPNCWDIIGGHVEAGETLATALAREIQEETGWELSRIKSLINIFEWEAEPRGIRREFDFLVEIEGDLARPQLEKGKHTAFRWISLDELDMLKEERLAGDDDELYQLVKKALEWPVQ